MRTEMRCLQAAVTQLQRNARRIGEEDLERYDKPWAVDPARRDRGRQTWPRGCRTKPPRVRRQVVRRAPRDRLPAQA